MKETTNYKFKKPGATDAVNIEDFNTNADIMDSELKKLNDNKQDDIKTLTITLAASAWVNNSISIKNDTIAANSLLWVTPTPISFKSYGAAGVYADSQGSGVITFKCDDVPTNDLSVIVVNGGAV